MTLNSIAIFVSVLTVVLFGLIAGFFYAYSVDVMRGLDLIIPGEAIHAMQGINTAVRNPVFFITFFMTPVVAIIAAVIFYFNGNSASALWLAAAAIIYLAAAFAPTAMINVPMNEALASLNIDAASSEAKTIWADYSARWTFWNTVRTLASTISLAASAMALVFISR
ncbi:MAG: anthrone oxygenase family protein [Salaquimonas sp.]